MMKIIYKVKISFVFAFLTLELLLGGCQKYLNQAPEASVNPNDAYKDFKSFQGFTEELYCCIVDPAKASYQAEFNIGDEFLCNIDYMLLTGIDRGDYWQWETAYGSYLSDQGGIQTSPSNSHGKGIWPLAWYGIRKANLGLANIDLLVNATQEEKDIIKGQLLFFRGYF